MIREVCHGFGIISEPLNVNPVPTGHIHSSLRIYCDQGSFGSVLVQQINTAVFPDPHLLMTNWTSVTSHLRSGPRDFEWKVPEPLRTVDGSLLFQDSRQRYWRGFGYEESTVDETEISPDLCARRAGQAFGEFQTALLDLPLDRIQPAIENFHRVDYTFRRFQQVAANCDPDRHSRAKDEIEQSRQQKELARIYADLHENCPRRIVHGDAKTENLLFDQTTLQVRCVLDIDTIMHGPVLLDFADVVRSAASLTAEDTTDLDQVKIRLDLFGLIASHFIAATDGWLTPAEQNSLLPGTRALIWEQALRFLADYLEGNVYYHVEHDEHNLDRCRVQLKLLESINEHKDQLAQLLMLERSEWKE